MDYQGGGGALNMTATIGRDSMEDVEFQNSRAEAKRAHAERMNQLRQTDERKAEEEMLQQRAAASAAQPKPTAFQIAVSVANAADAKDAKNGGESKEDASKYRLLGDLPSLGPAKNKAEQERDVKIALSLEIHNNIIGVKEPTNGGSSFMKSEAKSSGGGGSNKQNADPSIPKVSV